MYLLSKYLSKYLSIYLSIYPSIHPSIHLSVFTLCPKGGEQEVSQQHPCIPRVNSGGLGFLGWS